MFFQITLTLKVSMLSKFGLSDYLLFQGVVKTEFMTGPGRCDTSHLSDFIETWSK